MTHAAFSTTVRNGQIRVIPDERGLKLGNSKRGRWWKGFKEELSHIAPLTALAGVGAGGVALAGSVLLSGGAVLLVVGGSIGIAAYRSFPLPSVDPESIVGQTFSPLSSIPQLSEDVPFVGVFGETKTGKSTLLRKLQLDTQRPKPTRGLYAAALRTHGPNPKVFFLLDGEGESPAEQSRICKDADLLFFIVDHNLSDTDIRISGSRKDEHMKFWKDMATFFKDRTSEVARIHILLNKKDCWQKSTAKSEFLGWGDELVNTIKLGVRCGGVTIDPHSNFETDDVSTVWSKIEETIR